jgi:hypothetical protein
VPLDDAVVVVNTFTGSAKRALATRATTTWGPSRDDLFAVSTNGKFLTRYDAERGTSETITSPIPAVQGPLVSAPTP